MQVRFDPAALAQRGISVAALRSALQADNINESAGDLANGRQDVRFRILGQFDSLEPLRRTIVAYDDGGVPIRVEDIAEVCLTLEKKVYFDQCKGRTTMTVFVKREVGANVLELMDAVRADRRIQRAGRVAAVLQETTVMESACGWSSTTPITSAARWTW